MRYMTHPERGELRGDGEDHRSQGTNPSAGDDGSGESHYMWSVTDSDKIEHIIRIFESLLSG